MIHARPHDSRLVRLLCLGAGITALLLGIAGVVLPLLPTTPFILLAAACFARSSVRFHDWLLNQRIAGPIIREWQTHRAMPRRAKRAAFALMLLSFGGSILFLDLLWHRLMLAALFEQVAAVAMDPLVLVAAALGHLFQHGTVVDALGGRVSDFGMARADRHIAQMRIAREFAQPGQRQGLVRRLADRRGPGFGRVPGAWRQGSQRRVEVGRQGDFPGGGQGRLRGFPVQQCV